MNKNLLTSLWMPAWLLMALPAAAQTAPNREPSLPPLPGGSVTLDPAVLNKLGKELAPVRDAVKRYDEAREEAQRTGIRAMAPEGMDTSAPKLKALPDLPPTLEQQQPLPPTAPTAAQPASTAAQPASTAAQPASTAAQPAAQPAALQLWSAAAAAYGTEMMHVRLMVLLQNLNPDKPAAEHAAAYARAINCHVQAFAGSAQAMEQLAQAFDRGTLAGLNFPKSMAASVFFMNRSRNTLPDLTPTEP